MPTCTKTAIAHGCSVHHPTSAKHVFITVIFFKEEVNMPNKPTVSLAATGLTVDTNKFKSHLAGSCVVTIMCVELVDTQDLSSHLAFASVGSLLGRGGVRSLNVNRVPHNNNTAFELASRSKPLGERTTRRVDGQQK